MLNTLDTLFPDTAMRSGNPLPSMMTLLEIANCPEESRIVCPDSDEVKLIVSPAPAAEMASRKVPGPESAKLVTVRVAAFALCVTNIAKIRIQAPSSARWWHCALVFIASDWPCCELW
jgi:hypothetical protein